MKDNVLINGFKIAGTCFMPAILLCLFFLSCKKEKIVNNDLRAYVVENLAAYSKIPVNGVDTVFAPIGLIYRGERTSGFQAMLSEPAGADVEITGRIDHNPDLIKEYDSLYHTNSMAMPKDLFKLSGKGTVVIKAGQLQSLDSLKIELNNFSGLLSGKYKFIVPVAIESVSNSVKLKSRLMFVRFLIEVINLRTSISDISGNSTVMLFDTDKGRGDVFIQASLDNIIRKNIEVVVEGISDNAYVNAYNLEHGTNFRSFPSGSYKLLTNKVTLEAGNPTSSQNIHVQLTDFSAFAANHSYLLAVKIKDHLDQQMADPLNNIVYISMQKNNVDPSNNGLNGDQMNRSNWKINALGYFGTFRPSNILDGSNTTAWISNGLLPHDVTLDMGNSHTVKGFSIVPNYQYRSYDFLEMEVFSSDDGQKWKIEGKFMGTSTSAESSAILPDLKTVKFINPVTARYFKFNIVKTTQGAMAGMAELYGIN